MDSDESTGSLNEHMSAGLSALSLSMSSYDQISPSNEIDDEFYDCESPIPFAVAVQTIKGEVLNPSNMIANPTQPGVYPGMSLKEASRLNSLSAEPVALTTQPEAVPAQQSMTVNIRDPREEPCNCPTSGIFPHRANKCATNNILCGLGTVALVGISVASGILVGLEAGKKRGRRGRR